MKLVATRKADQNNALIDPWTAVHAGIGLAVGLVDIPRSWALAASVAYEFLEIPFERANFGRTFFNVSRPENFANQVVDVVVFMTAFEAGRRWNQS